MTAGSWVDGLQCTWGTFGVTPDYMTADIETAIGADKTALAP